LRGTVGYSHTRYVLAKEFASLDAHGTAKVASAGLSYPILRSQQANLTVIATYQSKELQDNRDSTLTHESKSSQSLPLALQFDLRDGYNGMTYGSVSWTPCKLKLDAGLTAVDYYQTRGSFHKVNLDVVRLQSLPAGLSLMAHLSWQQADTNLDSSEKLSLGGASGVRAYPSGEATGDTGAWHSWNCAMPPATTRRMPSWMRDASPSTPSQRRPATTGAACVAAAWACATSSRRGAPTWPWPGAPRAAVLCRKATAIPSRACGSTSSTATEV
jgi:hemolysin activation/secretion protein